MSIAEKKERIEPEHSLLSIQRQCELTGLARSSYYRGESEKQESAANLELMRMIDKEYTDHSFYGSCKMCTVLRRKGFCVNRKRIQRLMRKMGIQSVAPKP